MKNPVDLFAELGVRLSGFGDDAYSQRIIRLAHAANAWFMPDDIRRAVAEITHSMLQRDKLTAWLAHYNVPAVRPKRVLVVMAGNIPLVGFFDLLCVVAAGHHCIVKPSAKDTVLIGYVVELLRSIDAEVQVSFGDGREVVDAVIATGSDNANRYFKARYGDISSLLRGSRHSVAVLDGTETSKQLQGLADDVFAYSGLGCRSVSLIFVPRGFEWLPQPPVVNPKYRNNYLQTKALSEMKGIPFRDLDNALLVEDSGFPTALSSIHYTYYGSLDEVRAWLDEHDLLLQCVVTTALPHPRRADFGRAQSPALGDYPDQRDVVDFLLKI